MTDVGSHAGSPTGSPRERSPLSRVASRDLAENKPGTKVAPPNTPTSAEATNLQLQAELAEFRETQAKREELAAIRESELMAQVSRFQEMFDLANRDPTSAGSVPTVTVAHAEAVVQERETNIKRQVEQELRRKDAHAEAVEAEARRLAAKEAEGRAKSLSLESQMRALQQEWDLHEGNMSREVETQRATAQLTQRSLQETQGAAHEQALQLGTEVQRARMESQTLQAEIHQLNVVNAQLQSQVSNPAVPPGYLPPRTDDAQSVMLEAIRKMQKSSTGPSQFSKLAKFDSTKNVEEAAALWIDRVEVCMKQEDWFSQLDVDLLGKIGHLLDDSCFRWVQTLPPEVRSTSSWHVFKSKWMARFGLSRKGAMANLHGRVQMDGENARSYGESVKNLCLSASIDCNSFENTNRLMMGFPFDTRRQLAIDNFGDKSFEEILTRAVELGKVFSPDWDAPPSLLNHPSPAPYKKPQGKGQGHSQGLEPFSKKGGNQAQASPPAHQVQEDRAEPYAAERPYQRYPSHNPVPVGYPSGPPDRRPQGYQGPKDKGAGGGYQGPKQGGNPDRGQPSSSAPVVAPRIQPAVPMEIGAVSAHPMGRANAIQVVEEPRSGVYQVSNQSRAEPSAPATSSSIWDHLTITLQGSAFLEALSENHKKKLHAHLDRYDNHGIRGEPRRLPPSKPSAPQPTEESKGKPFQRASGSTYTEGVKFPLGLRQLLKCFNQEPRQDLRPDLQQSTLHRVSYPGLFRSTGRWT